MKEDEQKKKESEPKAEPKGEAPKPEPIPQVITPLTAKPSDPVLQVTSGLPESPKEEKVKSGLDQAKTVAAPLEVKPTPKGSSERGSLIRDTKPPLHNNPLSEWF